MKLVDEKEIVKATRKSKYDEVLFKAINDMEPGKAIEIDKDLNYLSLAGRLRQLIKAGQVENDMRFIRRADKVYLVWKK